MGDSGASADDELAVKERFREAAASWTRLQMKGSKRCERDGRLLLVSDAELFADNGIEADLAEADFSPLEGKVNTDHLEVDLPYYSLLKGMQQL